MATPLHFQAKQQLSAGVLAHTSVDSGPAALGICREQRLFRWRRAGFSLLGSSLLLGCVSSAQPGAHADQGELSHAENSGAVSTAALAHAGGDEAGVVLPRWVLWFTVDQMRGDYLQHYAHCFGEGGFKRLLSQGTFYEQAHYQHAITETAPGHATLFTGTAPREHGIVGNSWLNSSGEEQESVVDADYVGVGPSSSHAGAAAAGRSPRALRAPTVGDELIAQRGEQVLYFGLSLKDRGAILPAGQRGKALWWGTDGFVSSSYYWQSPSEWWTQFEQQHPARDYLSEPWSLLLPDEAYRNSPSLQRQPAGDWSVGFPHRLQGLSPHASAIKVAPAGDRILLDLARAVLQAYPWGEDEIPDLLSVSLSVTDYVGHHYGPESLEFEDQLAQLDRSLEAFFSWLDAQSMPAPLIILSADHGGSISPLAQARGDAAHLDEVEVERIVRETLLKNFGSAALLRAVVSPYVYLDESKCTELGVPLHSVIKTLLEALKASPKIEEALETAQLLERKQSTQQEGTLAERVAASLHAGRSGQIYVVPAQHTHFLQSAGLFATHGSPWEYDAHVPLLLSYTGWSARQVQRSVDVRSLAPTVLRLLGLRAAETMRAAPLHEVLAQFE